MASFSTPFRAVVAQPPVIGVENDATARETQEKNSIRAAKQIDAICAYFDPAPRLIVFPVLVLTGSRRHLAGVSMKTVATSLQDPVWQPIKDACARNNVYFVSTLQENVPEFPDLFFHTGFILGPQGVVLRSPKAQAYSAPEVTSLRDIREKYAEVFGAEAVLPVAETEIGKLGCLVESEVMVPEAARLVASKGAEIIVHPTLERVEQHSPQAAMKQAAAYANGLYIVSAAAASEDLPAGSGQWRWIGGTSMIVGPDGAIDASLGKQAEGLLVGTIDPNRLDTARKEQARETTPAGVLYRELYAGLA